MALTTQDFTKGIDFTGINPATGADHNVLIESAFPKEDTDNDGKGLILKTTDSALNTPVVPDASSNNKWRRYLWIRVPHADAADTKPKIYAWNQSANLDPSYLRWIETNIDIEALNANVASAQSDAIEALNKVDNLSNIANTALNNANTALTTANTAKATADGLEGQIDTANDVANDAKTDAANAMAKAIEALTAAGAGITTNKLPYGTAGQRLRTNDGATAAEWTSPKDLYYMVAETKAKNTDCGAAVQNENIRLLNTVVNASAWATLDVGTGKITLKAGTYFIQATVPANLDDGVGRQVFLLKDDNTVILQGTSFKSSAANDLLCLSRICGVFVLAADTVVKISDHWSAAYAQTYALGRAANIGPAETLEYFTTVEIWKQ